MNMPKTTIETLVSGLNEYDAKMVLAGWTGRGEESGVVRLKTAKPFKRPKNVFEGCANYVWRMLAFGLCGTHPYVCMPVMADIDIYIGMTEQCGRIRYGEPGYDDRRDGEVWLRKLLDVLVDRVEHNFPIAARKEQTRRSRKRTRAC